MEMGEMILGTSKGCKIQIVVLLRGPLGSCYAYITLIQTCHLNVKVIYPDLLQESAVCSSNLLLRGFALRWNWAKVTGQETSFHGSLQQLEDSLEGWWCSSNDDATYKRIKRGSCTQVYSKERAIIEV